MSDQSASSNCDKCGKPHDLHPPTGDCRYARARLGNVRRFSCYLDSDDRHPRLYGECLLPRDDDGIGFALGLEKFKRKYVLVTIEEIEMLPGDKVYW